MHNMTQDIELKPYEQRQKQRRVINVNVPFPFKAVLELLLSH